MSPRPPGRRPAGRGKGTRPPSAAQMHRDWLMLVDTEGPFLSVPVLRRVWPQGFTGLDADTLAALKAAKAPFESAHDAHSSHSLDLEGYRTARDAWVDHVLRRTFGWGDHLVTDDAVRTTVSSPTGAVTATSTGAFRRGGTTEALVWVIDPVDSLRSLVDDGWAATPIDRFELMLRQSQVPVGVLTDGRWWALVSAQPKTSAASGIVDAFDWVNDPAARDALAALLQAGRLAGGQPENRLAALFQESVTAAEDITEALGAQVRRAVELIVSSFSESATEALRRGEPDPLPEDADAIYDAAVTVMMRVVFLLFAEERGLLPASDLFRSGYGLSGQLDDLRRRAEIETPEGLDATSAVWHRLLATSRALYRGASFEDLRLPAYGGSLFDPERFAFLSATTPTGALALAVDDRVMMYVLDAVQMTDVPGEGRRPISFRDIDVEQIGYIYEGLLGYTCQRVSGTILGLIGKPNRPGTEAEVPLGVLNDLAEEHTDDRALALAILAWAKQHQPGAELPTVGQLAKALVAGDTLEDADVALRAITSDPELAGELRGWLGIIRRDLRDRPTVILPGGLVVVETASRRNAGAHYTPSSLANDVVLHALEPLVYEPGPHETSDRTKWRPKSPEELLELRVADIACGSGAFLVAAARYLAARLVEAWRQRGSATGSADSQHTDAIREVVAHCLYGADINPMAIEMCKLSLWLVSLDPKLPFSFVDDKMLVGNSLLGITDLEQVRALHIDPARVGNAPDLFEVDVDAVIDRAVRLRHALASEVNNLDSQRSTTAKRGQLRDFREVTAQLRDLADGVIAAGLRLGGKPGKALDDSYATLRWAAADAYPAEGDGDRTALDALLAAGLTPTVETDYERWQPLHWPLELPDVFTRGGFDAIIGNPPFLGGKKITGALGVNVREWLVNTLAEGTKGHADLVAYFFLRAFALLGPRGTLGLIATNTVAQGDSREVGLDRMVDDGFTITRAIQSRSWPAKTANLEYAAVWGTRGRVAPAVGAVADDVAVARVTPLLEAAGRATGRPARLSENTGIGFIGCFALGMGFVVSPDEAARWIAENPRNAEVLFPYLNGEDLNSLPDQRAPRWIIDFNDLSKDESAVYETPFERVETRVRPDRQRRTPDGAFALRSPLPKRWWQFGDKRPALRKAIAGLDHVLAIALVSKTVMPLRVPTGQVFSHRLAVFATASFAQQAVLSSGPHWLWAVTYSSTLETRVNYSPSDVFLTFPRPAETDDLHALGRTLDEERREIMLRRELGLTKLYNLVNDPDLPDSADVDVARLRRIHVDLDEAVMAAYGWSDVPLEHGFHTYRQMTRWTVSPAARVEILDRLLEENHRRAALQGNAPAPTADAENTDAQDTDGDTNDDGADPEEDA